MSVRLQVVCSRCDEVQLHVDDVRLFVNPDDRDAGQYEFTCPTCGLEQVKSADAKIIKLLVTAGVEVIEDEEDDLLSPPETTPPPLTQDDLLELHFALEDDDAVAEWLSGTGS